MFLQYNFLIEYFRNSSRGFRWFMIICPSAVLLLLTLFCVMMRYRLITSFRPVLIAFLVILWICSNVLFCSVITTLPLLSKQTQNSWGNIWIILTLAATVFMFVKATSMAPIVENRPYLRMFSQSPDKSFTLYFYSTGGNALHEKDVKITLEMADDIGNERFVGRINGTPDIQLVWHSDSSFSINGSKYIIENGRASPVGE